MSSIDPWEGKNCDDVSVYLVASTPDAEVQALWWDVVEPARPERLGTGRLLFWVGVMRWPEGGISGGRGIDPREIAAFRSARTLDGVADVAQDVADLAAEEEQCEDRDDGDQGQDERVLREPLTTGCDPIPSEAGRSLAFECPSDDPP